MRKPKWFTFFAFHLFLPDAVLFSPPCAFFASLRLSLPVEAGYLGLLLERSIIRTPRAIPKNAFSVTRNLSEWNLNSQHFLLWIRVKYISYPHCQDRRGKLRLHQTSWRCFNEAGVKGRLKDGVFPTNCPLQLFWKKFASTMHYSSAKEDNLKLHVHNVHCMYCKVFTWFFSMACFEKNLNQKHEERWNSASSCTGFKVWLADRELCAQLAARIVFALIFFQTHIDDDYILWAWAHVEKLVASILLNPKPIP